MPEQDISWRPVGFREVFSLLDLDRYDDIILDQFNLKRTGEKIRDGQIEILQQRPTGRHSSPPPHKGDSPCPITNKKSEAGKSLGIVPVGTAKRKYL